MAELQLRLFVDTNTVHYARLFLRFAKKRDLPPVGTGPGNSEEEIKQEFVGQAQFNHDRGRKLVDYLLKQGNREARIEYSPVTRLELTAGLLRGKAILHAAEEGVAHRMWNRMDETEILSRLDPSAFADILNSVSDLETDFDEAGIVLVEADPKKQSETWSLASQILGVTFLDLGDCAIYASALLAEADELVTADNYFRQVVNYMQNPGGAMPHQRAYFRDANNKMKILLSGAIGINVSEVVLPKAPRNW